MKNLFLFLFIARVTIPMGQKVTYENVETFFAQGEHYRLILADGRTVYVPTSWTVIEEAK